MNPQAASAAPHLDSSAGTDNESQPRRRGAFGTDPATALTTIGICSVILGGLVAAATGPLDLAHGSWAAAYLVLVAGVAQCAMGYARARRPEMVQPLSWAWAQTGAWNLGNALVVGGTAAGASTTVDFGSALLLPALAIALHADRPSPGVARRPARPRRSPWVDWAYRIALLLLAISIPVGIVLSHLRHA